MGNEKYGKYEMYQELKLLIHEDEIVFAGKAAEWQGNLYGVDGAGLADLPTLNDIAISDEASVADVAAAVNEMTYYFDTNGCQCGEVLDVEDYEIVYDPLSKQFLAVSELETDPVYIYRDGHNWKYIWLPEPDHIVEVEEDEDPHTLDKWDGHNYTHGGVGCHAEYYQILWLDGETVDDKYLVRYWSQWEGAQPHGEIVSSEELEKMKMGE